MSIVGEAEVVAVLNTTGLKEELAAVDTEGGLGAGAKDAGEAAGADVRAGVKDGSEGIANDLGDAGLLAGANMKKGVEDGTKDILGKTEEDVEKSTGRMKGVVDDFGKKASSSLESLGVPSALLTGPAVLAVGFAAVGAAAIDMGEKMQTADASIATTEGISVKAATNIGNAFLGTAGKTEFSGQEMAVAFGTVAGQLKATEGHALDTKSSLDFMNTATDLATAKGISLATSTGTLAATLQAFQLPVKDTASAANVLFNASNATGQGVDTLGAALDKMKAKLGAAAPSLGEMGGLLVDLTNHGETGRVALTAVNTGLTALLKPAEDMTTAQAKQNDAFAALPPHLKALATEYLNGSITSKQLTKDNEGLSSTNSTLFSTFTSSVEAVDKAKIAQQQLGITMTNSKGQLLPLKDIIGQLHDQIKGMSDAQALAKLTQDGLGTSAKTLLTTIQAGPDAFQKATDSVTAQNSVTDAATVKGQTLSVQFDTLKSTVVDFGTQLGQELIPILQQVMQLVEALIPVIGTILKAAFQILTPIIKDLIEVLKPLIKTITDLIDFVVDVFTGKWSAAWQAVEKLFTDAWDTIKALVLKIPEEVFGTLGTRIRDVFADAGTWLLDIGKQIVEGLIHGIEDAKNLAVDAAKGVGHAIEDGFKDVLHIFSPSQVFMEHGRNITAGLAAGIDAGTPDAVAAVTRLGNKLALTPLGRFDALSGSGSGIGTSGTSASGAMINLTLEKGAFEIHLTNTDDQKLIDEIQQQLEDGFRYLNTELRAGISQLSAKAS